VNKMPLYARKRDANERDIVDGLRDLGCYVIQENNVDLWVLPPRSTSWTPLEVKTEHGRLTSYQNKLHQDLRDNYQYEIPVVKTLDEALQALGMI